MGSKSNDLEDKVLDHVLGTADMDSYIGSVYIGLFNTAPTDSGTAPQYGGEEIPVAGGTLYDRVAITFDAAIDGTTQNAGIVTFPTAGANWATGGNTQIVAFGLFDDPTPHTGNMLYWGAVTPFKTVLEGDTASFADGALVITED